MKRLFLPLIIIICIAPVLMQCEEQEKQENIDYSKDLRWTTYTTSDGLASHYVISIFIDKEGNKWFGTDWGVSKFDGNTWTTYTKLDGLADNSVQSIAIDKEGNKWFGTHDGVSNFDGKTWTTYTKLDGLAHNLVISIAIDKEGNKWFGTHWGGVSKFDGNTWTTYTELDGLAGNNVVSIAIDKEGNKWFGTNEGVSKFDGNTWTNYTISDGISLNNADGGDIAFDNKGNMWFLTDGRVSKFDGKKWTNYKFPNYTTSSGLFCDYGFSYENAYRTMVAIDAKDNLWVVRSFEHYEGGCGGDICPSWYWSSIMFFDGKKWTTVYGDCASTNNSYFVSFAIDKENNKWFGTNQGVKKLSN